MSRNFSFTLGEIHGIEVCEAVRFIEMYTQEREYREIFELNIHGYHEEAESRLNDRQIKDFHENKKICEREFEWDYKPYVDRILKERQNERQKS